MKKFLLTSILFLFCSSIWSQINCTLTREQMLEDFDYMYNCLEKVSPRFEVRRLATGVDVLAEIQQLRQYIDTVPSESDFYEILNKAMRICKDMHIGYVPGCPYKDMDTAVVNKAKRVFWCMQEYEKYDPRYQPFQLYYMDGKYFVPDIYDKDFKLQIPAKSQLLEVNGLPIDEYISKWVIPVSRHVLWDAKYKKYYVTNLFSPQRLRMSDHFFIKYLLKEEVKEVTLFSYQIQFPKEKNSSAFLVNYFPEDQILYIRVPSMNTDKINFYKKEIETYRRDEIKKVVIDVRGNAGGNDQVWMEILSAIIKKPICFPQRLAFKNNHLVNKALERDNIHVSEYALADKNLVIGRDTLFCLTDTCKIHPSDSTLNYQGNIYMLTDMGCFSSTLAFIALARNFNQLVTIGSPLGYFGGQGIRPFYFILPNSGLAFRVECSMDVTNVNDDKPENYFNNKIKITFIPTLDDMLKIREYEGDFYGKKLYEMDPLFKKVLELP